MMNFSYTILYVKDVYQAVAFYEQAFGLKQRFIHESGQYAEMETETTTLAFAANDLAKSNLPQGFQENSLSSLPAGMEVGFVTDDVAAVFQSAIAAGANVVVEPKVKPWGQTVAYVRDLDGVLVSINSPMS
ncbi:MULTISPECIES: VOC family protein [unclassified Microcoleus]|uniref:VOC family protein n=1 Tax=unclassified Microcoleus TaxID=2642155 RepID=UPI002FCEA80B